MFRPLSRSIPSLRCHPCITRLPLLQPTNVGRFAHISRFHSTPTSYYSQSLLSRLARRAWYKNDGFTPRSKKKGMLFFTGVSLMILLSYSALSLLWDVEDLVLLLAAFIQLQQIDAYTYEDSNPESKRNWEDWGESAMYFKSICKPVLVTLTWAEPRHVDRFFDELEDVLDELDAVDRAQNPSGEPDPESLKTKIHTIMNDASHAVHRSLLSLKNDFVSNSDSHSVHSTASRLPTASTDDAETTIERASEVVQHIRAAIEAILKALQERVDRHVNGEIDKELGGWLKMRGEGGTSGKGGKGKGYDIIG